MVEIKEFTDLVADIREQVTYYKELGVELLDVDLVQTGTIGTVDDRRASVAEMALVDVGSIPRELPGVPIAPPSAETAKPNVKRPSKLSALPSLSNRPTANGLLENGKVSVPRENEIHDAASAEQMGRTTKELTAKASLAEALFDVGPELPTTGETIEDIRKDIGDCTRCELYSGRT